MENNDDDDDDDNGSILQDKKCGPWGLQAFHNIEYFKTFDCKGPHDTKINCCEYVSLPDLSW